MSTTDVHGTVADSFDDQRHARSHPAGLRHRLRPHQHRSAGRRRAGLAILATIAVTVTVGHPSSTPAPDALTSGYTTGLLDAGGFYLVAILAAVVLLRPASRRDTKKGREHRSHP